MKKIFTLIMGMLLICSGILARTPEEAAAIASGFMSQKGTQENVVQRVRKAKSVSVAPSSVSLEYTQLTPANENAVYVFNHADDGFVLVSAMDESREVLGYSDSGRFDKNDIPENMQFWLQMYASELARADVNKPVLKSGQTAMKRALKTPAASYPVITPILGNVMWGQDEPYNNFCPVVNGERSVTGCVATAISQIMYVHKHPIKGTGSHSYTSADGVYASANFGSTTYDWNNMLPIYSNNYNTTQANAVATLMYHVGVSADMAYSPDGSGATSSIALTKMGTYFSYDKGIKTWPKDFLTEEEILSAVANDLSIGHPVYLSGATKNDEGHAFVCDGMKSDGYLHINWGWDGVANGYFVLSALDPENQGTGGSASDMAFTERVVIYTGIQPDQGGEAEPLVTVDAMTRTSADVISRNSKVSFSLNHFASAGMGTAKGTVCYYIYDTNDNLVKTIGISTFELETGYYYTNPITTSVAIPSSVANGEYKIEIGYTDDEGDIHPILVKGKGVVRMPMTISNSSITFGDAGSGENTGLKTMSVIDVINQNQSNTWQIDLYSENFWKDTPSENDVLIRLTLNSSNPYSIVGSYVLDSTGSAGSISSALYAEGYYHACYQYAPEDMHLTITVDANGALQFQYRMVISGVELKGSATINVPNWYIYINETYYYYQSYITYDLSATIPASKALVMTQTLSHTDLTEMSYFVEGRISSMRNTPEQIASYGTARFDISDDGTTKDQFYCYNTKWMNNSSFVTGTEVALGDDVVVYGQLQNYLGTTPEMKGYVYQHTSNSNSGSSAAITYELNGGVTNDYGWMNKGDMFKACMEDAGVTTLASLDELKAAGEASLVTICTPLGASQCQAILDNEKWDWLEAYIMNHQNADAAATVLTEGTSSAGWRYAIAAFFLEMQRATWPKSADFSQAGKVEAFQPVWQHGFANPTHPTEDVVLNAPYKPCHHFDGWYATSDFSGEKVTVVNGETIATLYAKWTAIYQETSEELTICYGDSLMWNGKTYTESGEYTVRLADVNGCDSIVTLYLIVNPIATTGEYITACDSYEWNGQTYTASGEYIYTTVAANGCDSVVTLHLTINKSEHVEFSMTACDSYEWHGLTYTQSGDYTYTTTTDQGCERVEVLHLTINKSEYVEETVTACDFYEWHGLTYTQSGDYTYTTTTDQGCERVEVLHLTINKSEYVEETVTACDSYEWHGLTYTLSGDYTYTTTTDQGCERVEVLHLTILPAATTESEELVLCLSELPYEWYGQTLTEAGSYTTSEQYAGMECDSVIHELTVNVYVQTLPATVTQPIVRTGEAIDVTIPTAEIQAHIAAETWYAPNAEVAWYIMEDSDWATLTDEPVVADIKEVVLKYTVETDCDLVESYKMVIPVETTDLEHIQTQSPTSDCQKIFYEDHIYILRNGKLYSIMGQEI